MVERVQLIVDATARARMMMDQVVNADNLGGHTDPVLKALRSALACITDPRIIGLSIDAPSGKLTFNFNATPTETELSPFNPNSEHHFRMLVE